VKPRPIRALLVAALALAAAAGLLLLRADPLPSATAGARTSEPVAAAPSETRPPVRRLAPADLAEFEPATRRRTPRQGVRGLVASPRVPLPDGGIGVDPAAWECVVYALVPNAARRVVDRIGIARESTPLSARGDFEIDLPTGSHLVLVQHRVQRAGQPPLVEAWYSYADVAPADVALVDLGSHAFAAATISGAVTGQDGAPRGSARVELSDEEKVPGDPLPRGVHLLGACGEDGRFSFSLARADGRPVVARVSASDDGASARRNGARPGDWVDLVLARSEPEAEVVFEIPWSADTRFWLYATGRKVGSSRSLGKGSPGDLVEERRRLTPGTWIVELFRPTPAPAGEWARVEVPIADATARRVRLDPRFVPARVLQGRVKPGAKVAWVTRLDDGSVIERDSVLADPAGRFELRCVPTTQTLLATGSILFPVPPGSGPTFDVGELDSG
jgi:hypothetical protein